MNVVDVSKKFGDREFQEYEGKNFSRKYFRKIFKTGDVDCYWTDTDGSRKILFKIRRNVIPPEMAREVYGVFLKHSKKVNDQRSVASGSEEKKKNDRGITRSNVLVRSNISGYFDTPYMQIKKHFKTTTVCRTTAFTRNNWDKWERVIPFFEIIAKKYKELAPEMYSLQLREMAKCPPGFRIGRTPFTTVTSNYNWRTACHRDRGDFSRGLGNLTVLGGKFRGGYLGFPQFRVAVDVRPGDVVIMDVHQWHCNTELDTNDNDRTRLSFVTYFREKMVDCNKKKIIDGNEYYYKG